MRVCGDWFCNPSMLGVILLLRELNGVWRVCCRLLLRASCAAVCVHWGKGMGVLHSSVIPSDMRVFGWERGWGGVLPTRDRLAAWGGGAQLPVPTVRPGRNVGTRYVRLPGGKDVMASFGQDFWHEAWYSH